MSEICVVSPYPFGLLLTQQLSEQTSEKVRYIQTGQITEMPFGVLLTENNSDEKTLLESLGLLHKQKEGICLFAEKKFWCFQEKNNFSCSHIESLESKFKRFFFQSELMKNQHLFSEYFLFYPSLRHWEKFKLNHSRICWESLTSPAEETKDSWIFNGKPCAKDRVFWLAPKPSTPKEWFWEYVELSQDFNSYANVVPEHFVFINCLSSPWTHDNLLSVFHKGTSIKVWYKRPYATPSQQEDLRLISSVKTNLAGIFGAKKSKHERVKPLPNMLAHSSQFWDMNSAIIKEKEMLRRFL